MAPEKDKSRGGRGSPGSGELRPSLIHLATVLPAAPYLMLHDHVPGWHRHPAFIPGMYRAWRTTVLAHGGDRSSRSPTAPTPDAGAICQEPLAKAGSPTSAGTKENPQPCCGSDQQGRAGQDFPCQASCPPPPPGPCPALTVGGSSAVSCCRRREDLRSGVPAGSFFFMPAAVSRGGGRGRGQGSRAGSGCGEGRGRVRLAQTLGFKPPGRVETTASNWVPPAAARPLAAGSALTARPPPRTLLPLLPLPLPCPFCPPMLLPSLSAPLLTLFVPPAPFCPHPLLLPFSCPFPHVPFAPPLPFSPYPSSFLPHPPPFAPTLLPRPSPFLPLLTPYFPSPSPFCPSPHLFAPSSPSPSLFCPSPHPLCLPPPFTPPQLLPPLLPHPLLLCPPYPLHYPFYPYPVAPPPSLLPRPPPAPPPWLPWRPKSRPSSGDLLQESSPIRGEGLWE